MVELVKYKPTALWYEKSKTGELHFTEQVVAKSEKLLDSYLHNLSKAKETNEIWKAIKTVVKGFDKLNLDNDGFITPQEREELAGYIKYAAETYGLKFEGDVTEEYRMEW